MSLRTSPRRGFGRRVTTATIPLLLAVGGGNAIAATPVRDLSQPPATFLKIAGVQGESADAQHPGEIDVKSFHIKAINTPAAGGGGAAGKVAFSQAEFTKNYDKSSPQLLQKVATGTHISTVSFTFRRPGTENFLVYKLDDVVVSSYEQGGDTGVSPLLEHVALTFSKITVSYTPVAGPP